LKKKSRGELKNPNQHRLQPLSKRKDPNAKLTDKEKLIIVQKRDMGFDMREIAEDIGCHYQTVRYVRKNWAPANTEAVRAARADLLEEAAGRFLGKSMEALEYITPDSMKHDRIEVKDENGKVIEVRHSGPTGFQNSNIVGHLAAQALKLRDAAAALRGEKVEEGPKNIADVGALLDSIGKRAKSLNIDIQLDDLRDEVEATFEEVEDADSSEETGGVSEDE